MIKLYNQNWLVFWDQSDILRRQSFVDNILTDLRSELKLINSAFDFVQCEASLLTPSEFVSDNYTSEDVFVIDDLTLRPETTAGSYEYAKHILNTHYKPKTRLPLVVRQHGKSFRREQDKELKHMRLKEFYQLEFQILYSMWSEDAYYEKIVDIVYKIISKYFDCYIEPSDRLPDYSEITTDIIVKWSYNMEVCSISKRKDFEWAHNVEVAIGTDRLVYQWNNKWLMN